MGPCCSSSAGRAPTSWPSAWAWCSARAGRAGRVPHHPALAHAPSSSSRWPRSAWPRCFAALALGLPSLANDAFPGHVRHQPAQHLPVAVRLHLRDPADRLPRQRPDRPGGGGRLHRGLAAFFRFTNTGIAVRASAESADRAVAARHPGQAGPDGRLEHRQRARLRGRVPAGGRGRRAAGLGAGPAILVRALAACVIGGMTNLPMIFAGAVTLGVVEQAISGTPTSRAWWLRSCSWSCWWCCWCSARPVQPHRGHVELAGRHRRAAHPAELAQPARGPLGTVRAAGAAGRAGAVLPLVLSASRLNLVGVILVFAMVGVSLVVLTGWAGQVSLGAVAFLAIGAAVGGAVTSRPGLGPDHRPAGGRPRRGGVSIVIGLPALRIRGPAAGRHHAGLRPGGGRLRLNRAEFGWWLPLGRIERPTCSASSPSRARRSTTTFVVACLVLVLSVANACAARGWAG